MCYILSKAKIVLEDKRSASDRSYDFSMLIFETDHKRSKQKLEYTFDKFLDFFLPTLKYSIIHSTHISHANYPKKICFTSVCNEL